MQIRKLGMGRDIPLVLRNGKELVDRWSKVEIDSTGCYFLYPTETH